MVISVKGQPLYLPSRIRRCIAERVGRILASQAERKACYTDVLRLVEIVGVEGNLDTLVKRVALTLIEFGRKFYRRALIRQTLRTLRRYYYRLGIDLTLLTTIPYTHMIRPRIHSFIFPYAPDDGQVIQITWEKDEIAVRMKLPQTPRPVTRRGWEWHHCTIRIPPKILRRVNSPKSRIHLPTLRYLTLKGGLELPFLETAFSVPRKVKTSFRKTRVVATDLGVTNMLTSVVCEAGSQLSSPLFWSPDQRVLQKIDHMYHHVSRLQRKLDRYPANWQDQGKRTQEQARLYRKLNRYRELILHLASNSLMEIALQWQCSAVVLEDLRSYKPPKHKRKLSRKLANWLRGAFYEVVVYKARRMGITVKRVSARWTSSYCPRCGAKGQKITDPLRLRVTRTGRFFWCKMCGYHADRDYIGAVNIYRMYQEQHNKRYCLCSAKPVSYMGTGIPPNRPGGASAQVVLGR